jgi:RNA polymerase sigma-70 factor (family 1)
MQRIPSEQFKAWSYGLRASNHHAYADLYNTTYDILFRYAWYFTRNEEACYDILQDVYLKLWRVRATIDPDRSLKALLYQMVRNHALNHERSRKRRAATPLHSSPYEPAVAAITDQEIDADVLRMHIRSWIDALPARRREAFQLSRYEGLSHDEIARVMGLTPKTVNNHIVLALQSLRSRLQEYEQEKEPYAPAPVQTAAAPT